MVRPHGKEQHLIGDHARRTSDGLGLSYPWFVWISRWIDWGWPHPQGVCARCPKPEPERTGRGQSLARQCHAGVTRMQYEWFGWHLVASERSSQEAGRRIANRDMK